MKALINLGNFNNVEVEYDVEAPARDGESASDAIDRVERLVEAKLTHKAEEIRKLNGV